MKGLRTAQPDKHVASKSPEAARKARRRRRAKLQKESRRMNRRRS